MRVNLRCSDVRVPQHRLHRPQIGTALEQMRRERVPEAVRPDTQRKAKSTHVSLEALPEPLPRKWPAPCGHEDVWTLPSLQQRRT